MKILLTCSNDHPGVRSHLLQLKNVTVPRTVFYPIEELISIYPDYKRVRVKIPGVKGVLKRLSILKLSTKLKSFGDNVILGSWKPYYSVIIEKLNKLKIKPSILWCSTVGQSEMSWVIELERLKRILELLKKGAIRYLLVPEKTYRSLSHIDNVKYFPHPVNLETPLDYEEMELYGNNVDLFFKFRPGKNALQQMLTPKYTKTKFHLHTNIKDKTVLDIAKKLNLSFIHHSWLPGKKYFGLIKNMDMSLQVTWTESFNYAVCERMIIGIPTLVSSEVFLISKDKFLKRYLVVETPDSPIAIAQKIDFLFDNKNLMTEIVERSYERITKVAERYNKEIKDQLKNLFD
ncbi:glycosyltransferase [candidate division WOR-3 bacterium]|nr:glycosyltransferase [candidate division WOR-3 bacterium]